MVRLDLAFLLCCCKAILGPLHRPKDGEGEPDFYQLLGVQPDASPEDIKRAYKRQSLQMHPDKLAQRGKTVTEQDKAQFTRMKEAYEILSDPHKRETYDAVGERGLKWLNEPFTIDPREIMNNFAASSTLDRSKIFAIFLVIFMSVLLLPTLICLQFDGTFGDNTKWSLVLLPLWIWNLFILFYHVRVIRLGPIPKPEDIPEDQWEDPLPMNKRYAALGRFLFIILCEVTLALQLDHWIQLPWRAFCVPLLFLEGLYMIEKFTVMFTAIITVEDLEKKLGKSIHSEHLNAQDRAFIKRFFVIPSIGSLEHLVAMGLKRAAKRDAIKILFRSCFILLVGYKLDGILLWNWWGVFSPFWVLMILTCLGNVHYYTDVTSQLVALEEEILRSAGSQDTEKQVPSDSGIGSASWSQEQHDKREELQAQLILLRKQFVASCCSQILFILVLCIFAAKLDGASFSSLWLISPLILLVSILLCIIGCAIYCVHSPTNDEDMSDWDYRESHDTTNKIPPNKNFTNVVSQSTFTLHQRIDVSRTSYTSPTLPSTNYTRDGINEPIPGSIPVNFNSIGSQIDSATISTTIPMVPSAAEGNSVDDEPGVIQPRLARDTCITDSVINEMGTHAFGSMTDPNTRRPTFEQNSHDID